MSAREKGSTPIVVGARTANERFRDRWSRQLLWSTSIAVAAHFTFFVAASHWAFSYTVVDPDPVMEADQLVVLPFEGDLGAGRSGASSGMALAGGSVDPSDAEKDDPATTLGAGGSDPDIQSIRDELAERLRRRGTAVVRRVAEPEPERKADPDSGITESEAQADTASDPSIDPGATTAALAELPEPDSLDLDRLAALQPELALMSASAWVLIRNQPEVEAYLRRGYREGSLNASEVGTVNVTLWIDRKGSVEWAEISKSSGHPELDEYALALFNEVAEFRAAREQGVSVSRSVTFSLNFPW